MFPQFIFVHSRRSALAVPQRKCVLIELTVVFLIFSYFYFKIHNQMKKHVSVLSMKNIVIVYRK